MASTEVIRNLVTKYGFDLTDFQKGCAKVASGLKGLGKNIETAGKAMTKGITTPAIAAASGLTALTLKTAATADDLKTLSTQTGWSTTDLQKMKYAADQVGYGFDNLKPTLSKITAAVGAAQKANEEFIQVSDKERVSIMDTNGKLKSNQQLLFDLIDTLGGMTDETARDAAAQKIFGKSFMEINPLIAEGSAGLAKLANEAERVGAVMSEKDVNAMAALSDEVDSMKAVIASAGAQVAVAFAPALQSLKPIITDTVVPVLKGLATTLSDIFKWFSSLSPQTQKFILLLGGIAVAAGPAATIVGKFVSGIGNALKALSNMSKATSVLGFLKSFTSSTGLVVAGIAAAVAVIGGLIIAFSGVETEADKMKKETDELTESIKDMRKEFEQQEKDIKLNSSAANKLANELYNLEKKESKSVTEKQRMKAIVNELNKIVPDLNLAINEQTGLLNKNAESTKDVIEAMKKQALIASYMDDYTEAIKKQEDAENALNKANEAFYNSGKLRSFMAASKGTVEQMLQIAAAGNTDSAELNSMAAAVVSARGALALATDTVDGYDKKLNELGETTKTYNTNAEQLIANNTAISKSNAKLADQTEDEQKEYQKLYEARADITQNAFKKIKSTIDVSYSDMLENLKANSKKMASATKRLDKLRAAGLSEGIIQQLMGTDGGVGASKTIKNLYKKAYDKDGNLKGFDFTKLNNAYASGGQVAANSIAGGIQQPVIIQPPVTYGNYAAAAQQAPVITVQPQADMFKDLPLKIADALSNITLKGNFKLPFSFSVGAEEVANAVIDKVNSMILAD